MRPFRSPPALRRSLATLRASVFARDVGWLSAAEAATVVLGLIRTVLAARWLGPQEFGAAALVVAYVMLLYTLFDPRSEEAVVRYLSAEVVAGRREAALAVPRVAYGADALVATVGLAIVVGTSSWVGEHLIETRRASTLLVVFGVAAMASAAETTSRSTLIALRSFPAAGGARVVGAVARTGATVALVAARGDAAGFVYGMAIGLFTESAIVGLMAHAVLKRRFGGSWLSSRRSHLGEKFREMVRFMFYTDASSLAAVFVKEADVVILGAVSTPSVVGQYRLARSVTALVGGVTRPLQMAVYPRLATRASQPDGPALRADALRYALLLGLPLGVTVLLGTTLVPIVLPAVAGDAYRGAIGATQILLAGSAVVLALFWVRPVFLATGRVRYLLWSSIVATALTVAGYVLLGTLIGAEGVALSRAAVAGAGGTVAAAIYYWRRSS